MPQAIELHRMFTGVESCIVEVDDETLARVKNKTISRTELNDMFEGQYLDSDPLENDLPHSVYIINQSGHPTVLDYEAEAA